MENNSIGREAVLQGLRDLVRDYYAGPNLHPEWNFKLPPRRLALRYWRCRNEADELACSQAGVTIYDYADVVAAVYKEIFH